MRVALLASAFPKARFVDLARDGRPVALSLARVDWWPTSQVWWYGGTPQDWGGEGRDPWELCARHWVEEVRAIDAGLSSLPAERVLRLRYEDVVADPDTSLKQVAGFAGFREDDPRWLIGLDGLSFPDANEKWRTALDPTALATIERVQHAELARAGYL